MNRVIVLMMTWMLLVLPAAVFAGDEELVTRIESVAKQVYKKFENREAEFRKHPERIHDAVQHIIKPHFDFSAMSQSAMGKYWRKASSSERKAIADAFGELLIRTYSSALLNYSGKPIEYGSPRRSKDNKRVLVPSNVTAASGSEVPIDYILHQVSGKWKVSDVKIEGISLAANYRTSFASEIRKSGISGLLAKLRDRNKSLGG